MGFLAAAILWRRPGSAEPSGESLQRLFYGWMVAVNGISKKKGPEQLARADLHEITGGGGFQK